jgi:hypothetical protein
MDLNPKGRHSTGLHIPISLPYLPQNWIAIIFDLAGSLRHLLDSNHAEGMYEILDYDATLELVDPEGQTAIFKRRQKVKFLQDNVIAFQDYAWGDGEIFADYRCSPGIEVDRYQEGDQWNVLISLRETKSRGDTEDFYTERKIKGGFTKDEEWWQTVIRHQTRQFRLAILFPKKRPCQRAVLIERSKNRTTVFDQECFTNLPDGRQLLAWETDKLRRLESYTIKWRW